MKIPTPLILLAFAGFYSLGLNSFGQNNPVGDTTIYSVVEQMPEFTGGRDSMLAFVQRNLHFPNPDKDCRGTVYIEFTVEKDGTFSNLTSKKVVAGCPELTDEAIRLIKTMPKWTPGMENGRIVRVKMILPMKYSLN